MATRVLRKALPALLVVATLGMATATVLNRLVGDEPAVSRDFVATPDGELVPQKAEFQSKRQSQELTYTTYSVPARRDALREAFREVYLREGWELLVDTAESLFFKNQKPPYEGAAVFPSDGAVVVTKGPVKAVLGLTTSETKLVAAEKAGINPQEVIPRPESIPGTSTASTTTGAVAAGSGSSTTVSDGAATAPTTTTRRAPSGSAAPSTTTSGDTTSSTAGSNLSTTTAPTTTTTTTTTPTTTASATTTTATTITATTTTATTTTTPTTTTTAPPPTTTTASTTTTTAAGQSGAFGVTSQGTGAVPSIP